MRKTEPVAPVSVTDAARMLLLDEELLNPDLLVNVQEALNQLTPEQQANLQLLTGLINAINLSTKDLDAEGRGAFFSDKKKLNRAVTGIATRVQQGLVDMQNTAALAESEEALTRKLIELSAGNQQTFVDAFRKAINTKDGLHRKGQLDVIAEAKNSLVKAKSSLEILKMQKQLKATQEERGAISAQIAQLSSQILIMEGIVSKYDRTIIDVAKDLWRKLTGPKSKSSDLEASSGLISRALDKAAEYAFGLHYSLQNLSHTLSVGSDTKESKTLARDKAELDLLNIKTLIAQAKLVIARGKQQSTEEYNDRTARVNDEYRLAMDKLPEGRRFNLDLPEVQLIHARQHEGLKKAQHEFEQSMLNVSQAAERVRCGAEIIREAPTFQGEKEPELIAAEGRLASLLEAGQRLNTAINDNTRMLADRTEMARDEAMKAAAKLHAETAHRMARHIAAGHFPIPVSSITPPPPKSKPITSLGR